jgi:hypothetical protein
VSTAASTHAGSRRRSRVASCALCAVFAGSALAACGGSSDNGVASKSPDAIVSAASGAINGVKSVHISGSIVSGGTPITLDLDLVSGKGGRGDMSESGLSFKLVAIGKVLYVNGSPGFWRHFGGAAAVALFQGKWLKAPAATSGVSSLAALTDLHSLFATLLSNHDKLARGATTTVNGQKAVAVTDTVKGGRLYVATVGPSYPVEFVKTGSEGGRIAFDRFNESVSLRAPANSIDISQLQG